MYVIVANEHIRKWLYENVQKYEKANTSKTVIHEYNHKDFKIILYSTNTLTIDGNIKNRIYTKLVSLCKENNYIGCDEVGVGDFFGPTVYTSVYLDEASILLLSKAYVNIKDSKKCSDDEIFEIYEKLKDGIKFEVEIAYDRDINNLNSIGQKVYYHNRNISKFENEIVDKTVIDLFTTENSFYKYSRDLNIEYKNELILETKADSKYICVALASIFSRAIFLKEIKSIESKYKVKIPLGSSNIKHGIDEFLNRHSKEELAKICKTSFKTYKDL